MDLWYLSFADPSGWLGGCIVEATDEMSAVQEAHRRKINPGGDVLCLNLSAVGSDKGVGEEFRNKALTMEDLIMMDMAAGGEGQVGRIRMGIDNADV